MNEENLEVMTQLLKEEVISKYGSIRKFAAALGAPSTTITNAFQRNLSGVSINTLIDMCKLLDISIDDLINGNLVKNNVKNQNNNLKNISLSVGGIDEHGNYVKEFSQDETLEIIRDLANLPKEAIGELKTVFEYLSFKFKNKQDKE